MVDVNGVVVIFVLVFLAYCGVLLLWLTGYWRTLLGRPLPYGAWQREVADECRRLGVPIVTWASRPRQVFWAATHAPLFSSPEVQRLEGACRALSSVVPYQGEIRVSDGVPYDSNAQIAAKAKAEWDAGKGVGRWL